MNVSFGLRQLTTEGLKNAEKPDQEDVSGIIIRTLKIRMRVDHVVNKSEPVIL